MSSLDNKTKMHINLKRDLFVVDGIRHGPLLLKVIVQTAYIDTRSTVLHLREQLSRLDIYITDVKLDVEVFNDNDHVHDGLQIGVLQRADSQPTGKSVQCVTDSSFVEFIKRRSNSCQSSSWNQQQTNSMP